MHGIDVLDLTDVGPGTMVTRVFLELGARVLRVRRPPATGAGDEFVDRVRADWLEFATAGSESLVADLRQPDERRNVLDFAARSDIVIEGFRPGAAARLDVGYEDVRAVNPAVVYCSVSGYGQHGPRSGQAGHDINYCATAGYLSLDVGEPQARLPAVPPGDFLSTPLVVVASVLAALLARSSSGEGQYLDVSMQESTFQCLARFVVPFTNRGADALEDARFLQGEAPWYSIYATSDGRRIAVGAVERRFFANLCHAVGRDEWLDAHGTSFAQWPSVRAAMARLFSTRTRDEWLEQFSDVDACVTAVPDLTEVLADPQLHARGALRRRTDGLGYDLGPALPVNGSRRPDCGHGRSQ